MLIRTEIIGHIGQDAEVKDVGNNQVINFKVAVTETWKNQQGEKQSKTTWFEVSKWGNNVAIASYLKKGTLVYVEGKPESRAYINNEGQDVAVNGIKARDIQLLGSKN